MKTLWGVFGNSALMLDMFWDRNSVTRLRGLEDSKFGGLIKCYYSELARHWRALHPGLASLNPFGGELFGRTIAPNFIRICVLTKRRQKNHMYHHPSIRWHTTVVASRCSILPGNSMDVGHKELSISLPGYIRSRKSCRYKAITSHDVREWCDENFKTLTVVVSVTVMYCMYAMVRNEFLTKFCLTIQLIPKCLYWSFSLLLFNLIFWQLCFAALFRWK